MNLWLGTSGFQYPEWKGKFYPAKLPASRMLSYYAERFSSTEINYTFRRIPAAKTILGWAGLTPSGFRFSFKAPQRVTHFAKLRDCVAVMDVFFKAIAVGNEKTGPVLFQLPPTFVKDVDVLRAFLADLPPGLRPAFEFRHESWFNDAVFDILRAANAALCIAESEELATPAVTTADFGYLRLRREDYTSSQIQRWAAVVRKEASRWSDAYVYFKHEESAVGPEFARQFRTAFSKTG